MNRPGLSEFGAIRQVFHALCVMGDGEDATELLSSAARREWMTDLARRAGSVARLDDTTPLEPGNEDLLNTLWELYAASRVRDALLLAHQPGPAGDSVRELDEALGRKQPAATTSPVAATSTTSTHSPATAAAVACPWATITCASRLRLTRPASSRTGASSALRTSPASTTWTTASTSAASPPAPGHRVHHSIYSPSVGDEPPRPGLSPGQRVTPARVSY